MHLYLLTVLLASFLITPAVFNAGSHGTRREADAVQSVPASNDLEKSEVLKSKDPDFILRNFRTMYVDASNAKLFGSGEMKAALFSNKDFANLRVAIVDDPNLAAVVLDVGYTFVWDYPFSLKHKNTAIVLVAGKGSAPFSGAAGATSVAKELCKVLKPYRSPSVQTNQEPKSPSSR